MKCSKCGWNLSQGDVFCNNCGSPVVNRNVCGRCGSPLNDNGYCEKCGNNGVPPYKRNICRACGAPLNEGETYCSRCGTPVGAGMSAPVEKKKMSGALIGVLIGAGVLLVGGLIVVGMILFGRPDGENTTAADPTVSPIVVEQPSVSPQPTVSPSPSAAAVTEVTVPNVKGLSQNQAESMLKANDLYIGTVTSENSSKPIGEIISQTPNEGQKLAKGGYVNVVVSKGANSPTPPPATTAPTAVSQTEHTYRVVEAKVTWDEARRAAESAGGHLVTFSSQAEFDRVTGMLANYTKVKNVWIGARAPSGINSRDSALQYWNSSSASWITGEPFTFTKWRSGEPSGFDAGLGTEEPYLQIFRPAADGGTWSYNDAGNDLSEYKDGTVAYVIEFE